MKTIALALLALTGLVAACAHRQEAKVDLSTPESTVIGFTKAAAEGNARLAQSYFLPGGVDYQDIWDVLTAKPGTSRHEARMMMESIDPNGPMVAKNKKESEHGLEVIWQVTFRRGFEIERQKLEAGAQHDLDATLKKTEKGWLIDGF